jgi:hypothetical protein
VDVVEGHIQVEALVRLSAPTYEALGKLAVTIDECVEGYRLLEHGRVAAPASRVQQRQRRRLEGRVGLVAISMLPKGEPHVLREWHAEVLVEAPMMREVLLPLAQMPPARRGRAWSSCACTCADTRGCAGMWGCVRVGGCARVRRCVRAQCTSEGSSRQGRGQEGG